MSRREETVSSGTRSDAPVTINKLPVYTSGLPSPAISDSAFAQADSGHQIRVGVGAAVNAGQVVGAPTVVIGENASAWGNGAVAIGKNVIAGQSINSTGAVAIGDGIVVNRRNAIAIGSSLVADGAFEDTISIGTQIAGEGGVAQGSMGIGKHSLAQGVNGIAIGTSSVASEGSSVAIGRGASCGASGLGVPNKNIAIGDGAQSTPAFAGPGIAIGAGATANMHNSIALGAGATTVLINECHIGSATSPINILTLDAGGGATTAGIRSYGTGGVAINNAANTKNNFWITDNASMLRPSAGAFPVVGNAVLVAGTKAVASTAVTANSIVLLARKTSGGTLGTAITYVLNAGVGFTINSDNALDTSTFSWMLVELN